MTHDSGADLAGRTLGDYTLLHRVGSGGMGHVYLARQVSLNREVALKVLRGDLAADPVARERFRAEAESSARLAHPNVVQVYSAGEADGFRFIALEFIEGQTLREYLTRNGPPKGDEAVGLLRQMAAALACAAAAGIVHRDMKPDNVLITGSGTVKIADFGLSRRNVEGEQALDLTQTGMTLGTPLYMSPEQVQGHRVDHRSDLYSLGVTAFHLLAGVTPFDGATAFEVSSRHVHAPPPDLGVLRPDLPPALTTAVMRLLAKNPDHRYQTARDLVDDLDRIALGQSLAAFRPPVAPARRALWPVAAAALLFAAGFTLAWALAPLRRSLDAPPQLVTLPARFQPARERELRARLADRATKPGDHAHYALDLAVLLLKIGALDEADAAFADLGRESRGGVRFSPTLAERIGHGLVSARRQDHALALDQLQSAVQPRPVARPLELLLFTRPDLAETLATTLDDLAARPGTKLPDRLDALRTPEGVLQGLR